MTDQTFVRVALALFACLAGSVHAATFDPAPSAASLNIVRDPVTLAPGVGNAIGRTEMITGTDSIVLPFVISGGSGGSVTVTLSDLGFPGPLSSLSFAATTSTSLLAQLSAPGSMTFGITGPGTYFATVYGIADPSFGSGLYSLNLSYAPVPLPAAAWLFASGLALVGARRKQSVTKHR